MAPAAPDYSSILVLLNQCGLHQTQPALFKTITQLINTGQIAHVYVKGQVTEINTKLDQSFTFGTSLERLDYKPQLFAGNLVFFFETDTNNLYLFRVLNQETGQGTWELVGAPSDATYLTWTDETARLPNSRELIAGSNIAFDDLTPGQRIISSTGGGGGGGLTIWWTVNSGDTAPVVGPYVISPKTENLSTGKYILKAKGVSDLIFDIFQNGVSILSAPISIGAGSTLASLVTFSLLANPTPVVTDDIFILRINQGTPDWQFQIQVES